MRRIVQLGLGCVVALGGACAQTQTTAPEQSAEVAAPATAPAAEPAADARSCVPLAQLREARVRSDQVIDFILVNGDVLRNRLPNRCPQLGFERAFTYSTSISQLCSTEIITVIQTGGGPMRGASCGLGQFVPVSEEVARLPVE